jgi:hypothetical protein
MIPNLDDAFARQKRVLANIGNDYPEPQEAEVTIAAIREQNRAYTEVLRGQLDGLAASLETKDREIERYARCLRVLRAAAAFTPLAPLIERAIAGERL